MEPMPFPAAGQLILAPMAGVTDLAFRTVCAQQVYPQTVPLTVRTVGDHTEIDLLPLSIHAVYQITTGK